MLVQSSNYIRQALRIIGLKVDRSITPDLAERGNVVRHDRASRERGFEGRHSKRLVSRGGRVNGSAAVQGAELGLRLRSFYGHADLIDCQFDVGADRNLGIGNRRL